MVYGGASEWYGATGRGGGVLIQGNICHNLLCIGFNLLDIWIVGDGEGNEVQRVARPERRWVGRLLGRGMG